jgi:oligopeptidase B
VRVPVSPVYKSGLVRDGQAPALLYGYGAYGHSSDPAFVSDRLSLGAVLNLRPGLFHAAVAKGPFVDVVNTMLDASLPPTITEYEEWGNPNAAPYYEYIRGDSPYDNVEPMTYPHLLATRSC